MNPDFRGKPGFLCRSCWIPSCQPFIALAVAGIMEVSERPAFPAENPPMLANVTVFCFLASYLVAFAMELTRLWGKSRISRFVMIGFGAAGFVAHTFYLLNRSQQTHLPPLLSSTHDWMLVLAWLLVLLYLFLAFMQKELAVGVFALPVVLLLVGSTYFLSHESNTAIGVEKARRAWGMLHASLLVFGMGCVASGLVSGVMYLIQHRRLRTRHAEHEGLKMPSLAKLAAANRWSVMLSFLLLTLGFGSGVFLTVKPPGGETSVALTDPAVIISGAVWILLAAIFVWLMFHRGSAGKQVAWLTICSCGFLLLTVVGLQVITGSIHGEKQRPNIKEGTS